MRRKWEGEKEVGWGDIRNISATESHLALYTREKDSVVRRKTELLEDE